jgi:drug/metabolite transporter (DMT)-like permease
VNQTTATLIVCAVGMVFYAGCALRSRKTLKADDLLAFGLWCGGITSGIYMLLSALHVISQRDEETTRLYVGIFGLVLLALSFQKAHEMVKIAAQAKRQPQKQNTESTEVVSKG